MCIMGGLNAEAYDRSYSDAQLVRRIAAYFRPHSAKSALVALMVALISLAATVTPILISRGIDLLASNPQLQLLLALAALVTVLGVVSWVFNFVRQRFWRTRRRRCGAGAARRCLPGRDAPRPVVLRPVCLRPHRQPRDLGHAGFCHGRDADDRPAQPAGARRRDQRRDAGQ